MSKCGLCNRNLLGGGCPVHGVAYAPDRRPGEGTARRVWPHEAVEKDLSDAIAIMRNSSAIDRGVYDFSQMTPDERDLAVKIADLLGKERRYLASKEAG